MPKNYAPLATLDLNDDNHYAHPPEFPELVHLDDPATDILLDFESHQPSVCHPKDKIVNTAIDMKASGAHVMLVVEDTTVVGVISSEDLLGEKPMQIIQERRIHRDEILVRAVMTPREHLIALAYQDLSHSKIGHVLATLNATKQHYAIVVDVEAGQTHQTVHGLIYIYDILKRLDKNLAAEMREAGSLLELQKYLR